MDYSDSHFIKISGLRKVFREGSKKRVVLNDLDLEIDEGEFVAIAGESGSGKSTLLNLIAGIEEADSGKIIIKDHEITSLVERDRTLFRRRSVGFVFQFFNLIPTLTVVENISLSAELNKSVERNGIATPEALLERVGLTDRADSYPDVLSGGEQQRVAIARALSHDPLLILADEPTGNLDSNTSHRVMSLLTELVKEAKKTLILVTHSSEIASSADRILRLAEGRISQISR